MVKMTLIQNVHVQYVVSWKTDKFDHKGNKNNDLFVVFNDLALFFCKIMLISPKIKSSQIFLSGHHDIYYLKEIQKNV